MGSKRGVTARAALFVLAGAVSAGLYFFAVDDQAARDAAHVFCLSNEQRTKLTEAATDLKVHISPDGPRSDQDREFERVCDALTGAAQLPQQAPSAPAAFGIFTSDTLWQIMLGAALTWVAGFWRDERTQSRLLAGELDNAANRYLSAAHAQRRKLLESRQGKLSVDQVVLDGQNEVAAQLRKVSVLRAGWTVPPLLYHQLSDPQLGEGMNNLKPGQSQEQRNHVLQETLTTVQHSIKDVVSALERPWRWHGEMRGKNSAGAGGTSAR